jgi:hypothetical protein
LNLGRVRGLQKQLHCFDELLARLLDGIALAPARLPRRRQLPGTAASSSGPPYGFVGALVPPPPAARCATRHPARSLSAERAARYNTPVITRDDLFLEKARESLAGADSEFAQGRYDNCANRCYYACFQAAIWALDRAGIRPQGASGEWSHAMVRGHDERAIR